MDTKIQLRRSQWFYDDAGYYSYVLLTASKSQFEEVQQILRENGIQVLLAGRSYRPASNGVQYQWYIRVSDESGRHPTRERINGIFATIEVPETDLKQLEEKVKAQEEEIRRLKAELEEKEHQYQNAAQHSEFLRKENQRLQQQIRDLESRLKLKQIQETSLNSEDVDQIRQDYEETPQERDRQITDLRNKLAICEEEKREYIEQLQEMRATRQVEPDKGNPEYLFREMLSIFLPRIEFLGGSLDTLWREMQNPITVLRKLHHLPKLKGKAKRVRSANEWLEIHISREWRLYFRKCEDSKYQVLLSHKNTQKADIDWLKRQ